MSIDSAGTAYLVTPDAGPGPGVLVLHSWWGLTVGVKDLCNQLADAGFSALAPDLAGGSTPETAAEAEVELGRTDPNETAALLLSSVAALRSQTTDPAGPVSVVGYSMGASWALWLATRQPDSIERVVAYYGTQSIDFMALKAPVVGHFAADDAIVSADEVVEMEAHLRLLDKSVEFHHYEGAQHWFAEDDHPEAGRSHDPAAAALAWSRTLEFLRAPVT